MNAPDPLEVPLLFGEILDSLGLAYAVGGSWASVAYGLPRSTFDAAFVVDLQPDGLDAFLTAVQPEYYVAPDAAAQAVAHGEAFNVIHVAAGFRIDIFVVGNKPFNRAQLARPVKDPRDDTAGRDLWLASPEDTVLAKLDWFRQGGSVSERQWRDVLGVLKVQGADMDRGYMGEWAARLGVLDLLELAYASLD